MLLPPYEAPRYVQERFEAMDYAVRRLYAPEPLPFISSHVSDFVRFLLENEPALPAKVEWVQTWDEFAAEYEALSSLGDEERNARALMRVPAVRKGLTVALGDPRLEAFMPVLQGGAKIQAIADAIGHRVAQLTPEGPHLSPADPEFARVVEIVLDSLGDAIRHPEDPMDLRGEVEPSDSAAHLSSVRQ